MGLAPPPPHHHRHLQLAIAPGGSFCLSNPLLCGPRMQQIAGDRTVSRAHQRAINRAQCLGSAWRMRSDVNYQQEIDSSMTTHDSINLLMSFLKLEISEEL